MNRAARAGCLPALVLLISAWMCAGTTVHAQSCCGAASPSDFGTVSHCRTWGLAAQLAGEYALAAVDAQGQPRGLGATRAFDTTLLLGGGVRMLRHRLQLHGSVPLRVQHRSLAGLPASTAAGIGDAAIGLRWSVLRGSARGWDSADASSFTPDVDLWATQRFPTGRSSEQSQDASGADVTGDGGYETQLGTRISSAITARDSLAVHVSYGVRHAHDVTISNGSHRLNPGDSINLQLTWTHARDMWTAFGAFSSGRWTFAPSRDGVDVPDGRSARVRSGVFVSHAIAMPDWDLSAALSSDVPVLGLERDVPFAGLTLALTLQRSFP